MGAPPVPRHALWGRWAAGDAYDEFVGQAKLGGVMTRGHHNRNYVLPLTEAMAHRVRRKPGTNVTVRMRRPEALPVVIRTWRDEAEILDAIKGELPHVPTCLVRGRGASIHSYVEGVPLSTVCPNGKPVDRLLIDALAGLLAQMSQVRREALPRLPEGWPRKDSQGFLRTLALWADRQIRQPNWTAFGGLFAALGIPEDALIRLAERVPLMVRRPFSLLHADLHRDNVIVTYRGDPPLICVDWELATYGDPLHDLATHLVRMKYPAFQWDEVIDRWAHAMQAIRPMAAHGLARDLRHYVAFERAQSIYPDVIRAATSLDDSFDQKSLDTATESVSRALQAAAEPLRLAHVPDVAEIERVLIRWRTSRGEQASGVRRTATALRWKPDERLPEHPDFPRSAVRDALLAEGSAPANRVFKGTGHLNSVVRVADIDFPVVVRRRLASGSRRERGYLSEHAVLAAIERSGVPVMAPRVLALGESHAGDPFAIHTYVGPPEGDRPPNHPVNGLLPHEADGLVDQLCALTRVDCASVDPTSCEVPCGDGFYGWLSEQLALLVANLPKESEQLARVLGLPGAQRLREILSRHRVTHRSTTLLHGDLNPWNLVRRSGGLTLIDWEMAMVGDPLYDLVRHMHLTPSRPEIRGRMFTRWSRSLPDAYTRGWQEDWRIYRWMEVVRSAYVDLDRLVTGDSLDAPNVRRAVDTYAMTLAEATAALGLRVKSIANPHLVRALPHKDHGAQRVGGLSADN
ncbi:phosphotransferase family protein [Streptomyces sp. NPDC059687]|uniref:Aminoglycoside phosphotransferase domain-containing protein n=1 Tax=Streptomyces lannensis TaxID=766498 RepID=A0ABP7JL56_9ACTN